MLYTCVLLSLVWFNCAEELANQQAPSVVQFCTPTIDLAVGDGFNIRDLVVDYDDPANPVNWSTVTFFYKNNATWHLKEFNSGTTVLLDTSDISAPFTWHEIYVRGEHPISSELKIQVFNSESQSQLGPTLSDPLCGLARGSVLSEVGIRKEPETPQGNTLQYCVYSITLALGDVFNIRDTVVHSASPSKKIDWTNVVFYYSDFSSWHIHEFSSGTPFLIRISDFGKGNRGLDEFRVSMRDFGGTDDHLSIKLTMNKTLSEVNKLLNNPQCGYLRDISPVPINKIQRTYPGISTVVFRYEGPILTTALLKGSHVTSNISDIEDFLSSTISISTYVSDLLGIPQVWISDCPQKTLRFECVQFFDIPFQKTRFNTKVWGERMKLYINHPKPDDTRGSEWKYFSNATVTGYSSLNNNQPLGFDAHEMLANQTANSVSVALTVIGVTVITLILLIIVLSIWKIRQRSTRV